MFWPFAWPDTVAGDDPGAVRGRGALRPKKSYRRDLAGPGGPRVDGLRGSGARRGAPDGVEA